MADSIPGVLPCPLYELPDPPALFDELPHLASQLADAPAALVEALLNALDIQVLYRPEQHQATIWATLTDTTPATITALLGDPRVTATQTSPQQPGQPSTPSPIQSWHKAYLAISGHDQEKGPIRGRLAQLAGNRSRLLELLMRYDAGLWMRSLHRPSAVISSARSRRAARSSREST
jgi:hypothetical protein